MKPEFPNTPHGETEARLTALLLGELTEAVAAKLRQEIESNAELALLYARLKATIDLVQETATAPGAERPQLKLNQERRQKLLAHFKTLAPEPFAAPAPRRLSWLIPAGIAALLVLTFASLLLPALSSAKPQKFAALSNKPAEMPAEPDISGPADRGTVEEKYRSSPHANSLARTSINGDNSASITLGAGGASVPWTGPRAQFSNKSASASRITDGIANGAEESMSKQRVAEADRNAPRKRLEQIAEGIRSPTTPETARPEMLGGKSLALAPAATAPKGPAQPWSFTANPETRRVATLSDQEQASDFDVSVKPGTPQLGATPTLGNLFKQSAPREPAPAQTPSGFETAGAGGGFAQGGGIPQIQIQDERAKRVSRGLAAGFGEKELTLHQAASDSPAQIAAAGQSPASVGGFFSREKLASSEPSAPAQVQLQSQPPETAGVPLSLGFQTGQEARDVSKLAENQQAVAQVERAPRQAGALSYGGFYGGALEPPIEKPQAQGKKTEEANEKDQTAGSAFKPRYGMGRLSVDGRQATNEFAAGDLISNESEGGPSLGLEDKRHVDLYANDGAFAGRAELPLKTPPPALKSVENELDLGSKLAETPSQVWPAEVQTRDNAFSTFSMNVSDVSFKLAAASLENGKMPDPATIRSEEFLNAFDYRDPEPAPGAPIGFAWERAEDPFAQNRDLLRFSIKTAAQGREGGRPLNLVLLLDNSGSMERADRVRILHEALRVLASELHPQDQLSVVLFARTAHLWVDGVSGAEAGRVADEAQNLVPQGGTNLEEAMNLAYQTALRHYLANGINRVVLLTDGAANLGNIDPSALKQSVEAHRKQGIALDCFGIGWEGYNDTLLEELSRNGDGRYGFINTPEEAATDFAGQLAGALKVAASDLKAQVEFNPARVIAYRQIGYLKHQLTKEQFRDNSVDAAELGAAESGNALYVIQVNPKGEGPLGTVRVRYKVPGTNDYREREWVVPYDDSSVSLETASPAMRLAATAAEFAEWLESSPYASDVTPGRLLSYLSGIPGIWGADVRPAKLEMMLQQAERIQGNSGR